MPLDDGSRRALLERIIASGDRRRRRWLIGPGVVLAITVLAISLQSGGGSTDLAVTGDPPESTTTTAAESAPEPSSVTTAPSPTTTVAEPSTTTTEPPVCRNSTDARCGAFYWDYDPATFPNAPLELSMTSSPQPAVAGEPVSFAIRFYDRDASFADNCAQASFTGSTSAGSDNDTGYSGPDGEYSFPCFMPGCAIHPQRYGPWDPPPPLASEPHTRTVTRVYDQPGDYTVRIEAHTGFSGCGEFEGYHSRASMTVEVHVNPAPPL